MRGVILCTILLLAACESKADQADQAFNDASARYDFVKEKGGGSDELCPEAIKVEEAALAARKDLEYQMAKNRRAIDCRQ